MDNPLHPGVLKEGPERPSKLRLGPTSTTGPSVLSQANSRQAVTSGHNVFRPDVYRVSEGYMN